MENFSNSESNFLHTKLSREEAIRRINLTVDAKLKAGTSLTDLMSWADSKFSRLPDELKMWKIPEAECEALLEELSQQDREKFWDCLFFYFTSARTDLGSCDTMQSLFNLAGIQNTLVCRRLYRKLTGASCSSYGFEGWDQVNSAEAFHSCLRRARVKYAVDWLRAWKSRQTSSKETSQGDK